MPRPKRSKVAPSAPITFPHLAKQAVASAAQKQKDTFSPASSGRVTTTSDDSDGLVVSKKARVRGTGVEAQEYRMSGALAPEDIGPTRLKPPSNQTRAALSKIAREADYARKVAEGKATQGDAAQARAATEPDQIQSSIPTESKRSTGGMGISSAVKSAQIGLGSRIGETPQPSLLGATFKKRARQPSLLQMLQTQNDPSDDLDDDEVDDFHPDDESTPMIKSMLQTNNQHTSSSSRQTSGSRKRKLASPEIQVPASQTPDPPSSPPSLPPQEQEDLYDLPAEDEERPEPTLPRQRSTQTPQRQIIDSDTLAPPQSSSPEKPKVRKSHTKSAKAAPRPQQSNRKQFSPAPLPLSSVSTNMSPVKPVSLKPLTTATLQNLLPRRRARPKSKGEYDIPSSSDVELDNTGLGEDEDELSFHATTKMRRKRPKPAVQKRGGKGKEGAGKRMSRTYTKKTVVVSDNENDDDNGEEVDGGEENGIDNENGEGSRGRRRTPALDGKAKTEMRRLADKFREVDEYTLDFEDMTGNSSSQMKDAR